MLKKIIFLFLIIFIIPITILLWIYFGIIVSAETMRFFKASDSDNYNPKKCYRSACIKGYENEDWANKFFYEYKELKYMFSDYTLWKTSEYSGETINILSPENIRKTFQIGSEQLIIFLVTLIVTVLTNLISGILTGIITTFIIHVIINKNISLFIRNLLKPNVLMFEEDDKYFVSVDNFSSFLNYSRLKSKLDQIPENEDVIIDFSMCDFVDHTVMENINSYSESFKRKGGHFEIIGLDGYKSGSKHPFAMRKFVIGKPKEKNITQTKRQKSLQNISEELHWNYKSEYKEDTKELPNFGYFKTRQITKISNTLSNEQCTLFDIEFSEGELIAKQNVKATMLYIELKNEIPQFTLDKEGIFEYIIHFAGFKDINIDEHPDFSKRFYLSGKNEEKIREFFTDELILFFESNKYYHIESNEKGLLIIGNERLAGVKEIKALADFGLRLTKNI